MKRNLSEGGYMMGNSNTKCLSDCQTIAEVFRFMAEKAESSTVYSGVFKKHPDYAQDLALSFLRNSIIFERNQKRESLLSELNADPSIKEILNKCVRYGVTVEELIDAWAI